MKEAREILGIPQREIAAALGVVTPMISYYEREETALTSDRVEQVADLLCLTIEEIYHRVPSERELKRRYYTRLLRELDAEETKRPSFVSSKQSESTNHGTRRKSAAGARDPHLHAPPNRDDSGLPAGARVPVFA